MNLARMSKAIYAGVSAGIAGFTIPAVGASKLTIACDFAVGITTGIVVGIATYSAPANKESAAKAIPPRQ
jgi:hypothetical protein